MRNDFQILEKKYRSLLPANSKPMQGELLSSWLYRMSLDHGLNIYEFCRICWPKQHIFERDIDRNVKDDLIELIALRTNCANQEVKLASLRCYEYKLYDASLKHTFGKTKWVLPIMRFSFKHKMKGLLFCPACFKKGNVYYKKVWRLSFSTVCPECGCYLEDCCSNCGCPICFYRNTIGDTYSPPENKFAHCYNCSMNLKETKTRIAPCSLVEVQKHLYDILDIGYGKEIIISVQYFDVLNTIVKLLTSSKKRFTSFREELFRIHQAPHFTPKSEKSYFCNLDLQLRAHVIKIAYWLLQEWPDRFISHCKKHRLTSSDVLYGRTPLPSWYKQTVMDKLYRPYGKSSNNVASGLKN